MAKDELAQLTTARINGERFGQDGQPIGWSGSQVLRQEPTEVAVKATPANS